MTDFIRFPHTPHLAWLGDGRPRNDKLLSQADVRALLAGYVVVEEKLDGANLGVSFDETGAVRLQNRGQYLIPPFTGQFAKLNPWIELHGENLLSALRSTLILFGEWCAARHSVKYRNLPDWFVAFDVFDHTARQFWSTRRRNELVEGLGLSVVPQLSRGRMTLAALTDLVNGSPSHFASGHLEGIVVRRENDEFLEERAKLVHPGFTQAIGEHWRSRPTEWNTVTA